MSAAIAYTDLIKGDLHLSAPSIVHSNTSVNLRPAPINPDWIREGQPLARNALSVHFRVPPREIVFLHRRLAGVFIMLATLGVELNARGRLLASVEKSA